MAYLTKDDQARIDAVIANVKDQLGGEYYPLVGLDTMAKRLGIKVYESDLSGIAGSLSGFITYDDPAAKSHPKIYIEKTISPRRKKFTLAHELGHHFLHEGVKLRLDDLDYSANGKNTIEESEANYFAASLLMPEELVLRQLEKERGVEEIAEYFQVSLSATKSRIKWLLKD
ncbi:hypothetical protein CR983_01600 [Candidatus Saccharibacteria bacterium]|nr:MAG: hypothetical protein CR983_01600 [Candidatus Saccharibacteria bacterium]